MTSLISFRRVVAVPNVFTLQLPDAPQGTQAAQEICTLPDGRTIVALFAGFTLPADQPAAIAASIVNPFVPTAAELDEIKLASPQVRLINQRVKDAIAQRYSTSDEIKLLRTAPSAEMTAYDAYAEDCRAWGRAEKAKLGL